MKMKIGDIIKYDGKEWCVTFAGDTFVRLERGAGYSHSVIVVPYDLLCRTQRYPTETESAIPILTQPPINPKTQQQGGSPLG